MKTQMMGKWIKTNHSPFTTFFFPTKYRSLEYPGPSHSLLYIYIYLLYIPFSTFPNYLYLNPVDFYIPFIHRSFSSKFLYHFVFLFDTLDMLHFVNLRCTVLLWSIYALWLPLKCYLSHYIIILQCFCVYHNTVH